MRARPVRTGADLKAFIDLPYRLYARDARWVAPFRRDVEAHLDRKRDPFFEHGVAEYFLGERDGRVVGRIAAIENRLHNETHGDRVGFFGFFECERDPAAAAALLDAAAGWLRGRGLDALRGPASFSVNDEVGLLVEGFDTPPTVLMPHNPPWYADLLEGAGLSGVHDLWVYEQGDGRTAIPVPARLDRAVQLLSERLRVNVRPVSLARWDEEIELLKRLYNASWEKNWGFVPMTDRELDHLAHQFKPIVVPDLVPFVEVGGEPAGFAIVLHDVNEVLRDHRAGRLFPAALKLLWGVKRRTITRGRILLLGVLPRWRGLGLDAVLYHWLWTRMLANGMRWGEAGWILDDNPAMNQALERLRFRRYKTYRLYERKI